MTMVICRLLGFVPRFAELRQNAQVFANQVRKRHAATRQIIRPLAENHLNSC